MSNNIHDALKQQIMTDSSLCKQQKDNCMLLESGIQHIELHRIPEEYQASKLQAINKSLKEKNLGEGAIEKAHLLKFLHMNKMSKRNKVYKQQLSL